MTIVDACITFAVVGVCLARGYFRFRAEMALAEAVRLIEENRPVNPYHQWIIEVDGHEADKRRARELGIETYAGERERPRHETNYSHN